MSNMWNMSNMIVDMPQNGDGESFFVHVSKFLNILTEYQTCQGYYYIMPCMS